MSMFVRESNPSIDINSGCPTANHSERFGAFKLPNIPLSFVGKATIGITACVGAAVISALQSSDISQEGVVFTASVISLSCLLPKMLNTASRSTTNLIRLFILGTGISVIAEPLVRQTESKFCIGSPLASNTLFLQKDAYVDHHIALSNLAGYDLLTRVNDVLMNGGQITPKNPKKEGGKSGGYLIKDSTGKTVAFFKPEDEGAMCPQNPSPELRKKVLSDEDIYFHKVDSFEQGRAASRQQLASILHVGELTKPPTGVVAYLSSNLFVDVEAESLGIPSRQQTKLGYLQEWMHDVKPLLSHHPILKEMKNNGAFDTKIISNLVGDLSIHPLFDSVALDEFQEISINDFLIYNEDRHAENILVRVDSNNQPHLIPIDHDSILPWKLRHTRSVYTHPKSKLPFTERNLKLIDSIDPDLIEATVNKMHLSSQASINAKMMAIVLKKFAAKGATIHDIEKFASNGIYGNYEKQSQLWLLAEECQTAALNRLPPKDKKAWIHSEYLRRTDWCLTMKESWCEPLPEAQRPEAALWQKNFAKTDAKRISDQINANFWEEFNKRIDSVLS